MNRDVYINFRWNPRSIGHIVVEILVQSEHGVTPSVIIYPSGGGPDAVAAVASWDRCRVGQLFTNSRRKVDSNFFCGLTDDWWAAETDAIYRVGRFIIEDAARSLRSGSFVALLLLLLLLLPPVSLLLTRPWALLLWCCGAAGAVSVGAVLLMLCWWYCAVDNVLLVLCCCWSTRAVGAAGAAGAGAAVYISAAIAVGSLHGGVGVTGAKLVLPLVLLVWYVLAGAVRCCWCCCRCCPCFNKCGI